ncbi:serine/threonine-protein kinase [Streptosporangium roseum]|uniref:Serine/threonine protein kinase n=1 Tax=Streptosporangium roseum (strain ATCC 12428 / DSM 43021 / JCM 3005 / KCTC 9067 / NCIMB 10171 / NRRL 2505 / NI 9100) TaxID=479432 RepID=D2BEU1_STRRD|nr:serine/threonine-protein kinase [Streptosporangium roseum]ACZ84454.1 serine/threonine protein kinase [Streptosporangium roseum DSM 43021]
MNPSERAAPGESQVIGGYLLRRVLGRGGMGTVYLAGTPTGGLAAVKVINPELARDPAFRRRFEREVAAARMVARFCTAPVLDAGIDGDVAYLVTEYVKGPDLAQAVREQGPMTGSDLEALAVGIAVALNAIHGAGVIHRDLKPSNVLLSPMGPRVIDFGIAKLVDGDSLVSQGIQGTPAFMAPEQVRGETPTPAADVYAWGGVIAFAGTGRLPFGGGAPAEVLYRIVNEGPRLDGLDGRIRGFVERAMAKDPARRPSAPELLGELVGGRHMTPATATQVVERTWTGRPPDALGETRPGRRGDTPERSWADRPSGVPERSWADRLEGAAGRPGADAAGAGWSQDAAGAAGQGRLPDAAGRRDAGPAPTMVDGRDLGPSAAVTDGRGPVPASRRGWRTPLLAGLAVVAVAAAGVVAWRAVASPGGEWPFHADFGSADHSWSVGSSAAGRADVTDGSYLLTVNPGWRLWKSAPAPDEPEGGVVVSGSARLTEGSGEFGVWCRGDAGTGDRYEFAVSGSGTVSITKRQAGQKGAVLYGPARKAEVRQAADNRIVAECRPDGSRLLLRMWVNETLAGEAVDAGPYGPGQTGVHAAPDGEAAMRVRFGSFDVRPAGG